MIETDVGRVRALSPAHVAVSRDADKTIVTGVKGDVRVSWLHDRLEKHAIPLLPGQQVVMTLRAPLIPRLVDTRVELAWVDKMMILNKATVEYAIYRLNKLNQIQLQLPQDPKLAKIRLDGPFRLDDPEGFRRYLEGWLSGRR